MQTSQIIDRQMCIHKKKSSFLQTQSTMTSWHQEWETGWLRGRHPPKHSSGGSAKQPRIGKAAMTHACKGDFYYLEQETAPTPCAWPNPWATQVTLPSLFIRQTLRLLSCNGKRTETAVLFWTSDQFPMSSPHSWARLLTSFHAWTFACIHQSRWGQTGPSRVHCSLWFQREALFLGVSGHSAPFLPTRFLHTAPHQSHTNDISEL